jgi:ssDNA-binding Zn-finger/Zn-ribbon topoisomerase 1
MRLVSKTVPYTAPENYSDEELARLIRHHYPNLQGVLKQLLDRFESKSDIEVDIDVKCPHCGQEFKIEDYNE